MTYYDFENSQKSLKFLWPLIGISSREVFSPVNTYLYCDCIDESILDYKLIALYKFAPNEPWDLWERKVLLNNSYLETNYLSLDGNIYVFNLTQHRDTVDKFLRGEYTKISRLDKEEIYKSIFKKQDGYSTEWFMNKANFEDSCNLSRVTALNFHIKEFKEKVIEDLYKMGWYSTKAEAAETIKDMKEICPIFDLSKESLSTELI